MSETRVMLGKRIREIRKGCKLSQEQLSELVGVDFRYIT
jgi:transcriptional regulator with XRE-family HTH domain